MTCPWNEVVGKSLFQDLIESPSNEVMIENGSDLRLHDVIIG